MTKKRKYQKKQGFYKAPEANEHRTLFSPEASGKNVDDADVDGVVDDAGSGEHVLSDYHLGDAARSDKFVSHWMRNTRPFKTYRGFRQLANAYGVDEVVRMVKIWHSHFVVKQEWSEEKFSFVLDKILDAGNALSKAAFIRYSFLYDHGRERSPQRSSGTTSTLYDRQEKDAKINDVLDAWDALEGDGEDD